MAFNPVMKVPSGIHPNDAAIYLENARLFARVLSRAMKDRALEKNMDKVEADHFKNVQDRLRYVLHVVGQLGVDVDEHLDVENRQVTRARAAIQNLGKGDE